MLSSTAASSAPAARASRQRRTAAAGLPLRVPSSSSARLASTRPGTGLSVSRASTVMAIASTIKLPFGSLVWSCDDAVAACLLPTEVAKPLAQIGLIFPEAGTYLTVLEHAVGEAEGFEIYDVRANSAGAIWTEADIMDGV